MYGQLHRLSSTIRLLKCLNRQRHSYTDTRAFCSRTLPIEYKQWNTIKYKFTIKPVIFEVDSQKRSNTEYPVTLSRKSVDLSCPLTWLAFIKPVFENTFVKRLNKPIICRISFQNNGEVCLVPRYTASMYKRYTETTKKKNQTRNVDSLPHRHE